MSLVRKIGILSVVLVALAMMLGGVAIYGVNSIRGEVAALTATNLPGVYYTGRVEAIARELRINALLHALQTGGGTWRARSGRRPS